MGLDALDNSRLPLREQQFLSELATFDPEKHYLTTRLRVVSKKRWRLLRTSLCPCLFNPKTVATRLFEKVDAVGLGRLVENPGFQNFTSKMEAHTPLLNQGCFLELTPAQVAGQALRRLSYLRETYLYSSKSERQPTSPIILLRSRLDYLQAGQIYLSKKERALMKHLKTHLDHVVDTTVAMSHDQASVLASQLISQARILASFLEGCRELRRQPETYYYFTPHSGSYSQFKSSFCQPFQDYLPLYQPPPKATANLNRAETVSTRPTYRVKETSFSTKTSFSERRAEMQ